MPSFEDFQIFPGTVLRYNGVDYRAKREVLDYRNLLMLRIARGTRNEPPFSNRLGHPVRIGMLFSEFTEKFGLVPQVVKIGKRPKCECGANC